MPKHPEIHTAKHRHREEEKGDRRDEVYFFIHLNEVMRAKKQNEQIQNKRECEKIGKDFMIQQKAHIGFL